MAPSKRCHNGRLEERCSSSSISNRSGSTPAPFIPSSPPRDSNNMTKNAQPEQYEEAQLELNGVDDLKLFMDQIKTGGKEEFLDTTHLKIVIDSSEFGDFEDDQWCIFLGIFEPLSAKVNHLSIIIKGNVIFTHNNYVKTSVHTAKEIPGKGKGKNADLGLGLQQPYPDDDLGEGPSKKPKFTRSTANSKSAAKPVAPRNLPAPASISHTTEGRYAVKKLPSHKVNFYIYEKAIIKTLIEVFSKRTPLLPYITIQGPVELSLRRHIISSINPEYLHDPNLSAEAGYAMADAVRVAEAADWEASLPDLRHLGDGIQDPEDFREWNKSEMDDVNFYGLGKWVVPCGKAGSGAWGWRVNGARLFRGPTGGWPGRND